MRQQQHSNNNGVPPAANTHSSHQASPGRHQHLQQRPSSISGQQQLSNSAMRQSSQDHILSGAKQFGQQQAVQPSMTPVQQKFTSSNMFHHNASINNYLSASGTSRIQQQKQQHSEGSTTLQPVLFANQLSKGNMKKSDVKQLQKYCEQNGLDFAQFYDRGSSNWSESVQQNPSSKSLSKERQRVNAPGTSQYTAAQYQQQVKNPGSKSISGKVLQSHRPHKTPQQTHYAVQDSQNSNNINKSTLSNHFYSQGTQHHSNSMTAFDRSHNQASKTGGLVNSSSSASGGGHQLYHHGQGTTSNKGGNVMAASNQFVLGAKPSQNEANLQQSSSSKMTKQLMPSQMSVLNGASAVDPQYQHLFRKESDGNVGQNSNNVSGNFSASNGYFSTKPSPIGRLSVERLPAQNKGNGPVSSGQQAHALSGKQNKLVRYQVHHHGVSGSQGGGKTGQNHSSRRSTDNSTSQKDITAVYANQKRTSIQHQNKSNSNSAQSLDLKYHIDSGVGVISGGATNTSKAQNTSLHQYQPRKDAYQRGIQVEMKNSAAIHSRRKHGSIDTYKQRDLSNQAMANASNIRQGQGEIAPQRAHAAPSKNQAYAKMSTGFQQNSNQLPKVVRNQTNQSSMKNNSSTPSVNNSASKTAAQSQGRQSVKTPSEEQAKYQASGYTNGAIRQSALSRGSIKQSSQHVLSGSNQMNLSLSQNSSRGIHGNNAGGGKSFKESSIDQIQERRIAYEASQGKMHGKGHHDLAYNYSQQQQMQNRVSPVKINEDEASLLLDKNIVSNNIVLQQQKQGYGQGQRHSRIRTNHNSHERVSNSIGTKNTNSQNTKNNTKRGAQTVAQNSPRHVLSQMKNKQPRIPEANQPEMERYYNHAAAAKNSSASQSKVQAFSQVKGSSNTKSQEKNYLAQAMQAQSSSLVPKTPSQELSQQMPVDLWKYQLHNGNDGQRSGQLIRNSAGSAPSMAEEDYLNSMQLQQQQYQQRLEESSTEQYSRKLQTPNPILDGGTGSGGATSLQSQTRQLLKDQANILEKLGYQSTNNFASENPRASNSQGQRSGYYNQAATPADYQTVPGSQQQYPKASNVQSNQSSQGQQKKTTLLQMQQQRQGHQTKQSAQSIEQNNTKTLNLSHNLRSGESQISVAHNSLLKQANTKTSANTQSTVKVNNPKFLQLSAANASKQSTINSATQNQKNVQLKPKKIGSQHQNQYQQQPQSNLIMHQSSSKRSSSQEMVVQNFVINSNNNKQQQHGKDPLQNVIRDSHNHSSLIPRQSQHPLNQHHLDLQSRKQGSNRALKGEKRSSSQPTVLIGHAEIVAANSQSKQLYQHMPKHYQESKKRYHENRRLSDDPNLSRQAIGGRTSQKSMNQQSRSSAPNSSNQDQSRRHHRQASVTDKTATTPVQQSGNSHNQRSKVTLQAKIESDKSGGKKLPDRQLKVSLEAQDGGKQYKATKKSGVNQKTELQPNHPIQDNHQDRSSVKRLRKQSSVPQLHHNQPANNGQNTHERSDDRSKSTISAQQSASNHPARKSQSNGPGRPQYSVNHPHKVARPDTLGSDVDLRRLITEDDENDIRQVASDINEKAFYGKIIRTKKAMRVDSELAKLSPRSQEIGYVMKKVERAFALTQQPPVTDISFYRIGKMLGRGAFGKVNLAMHKLVRKLVALKSLNKADLTDEVQKAKLMKEVNLLLKLRHNHVVKIYETIETQKHIIIVMELCAGGDLLNYVRKRRRLKEPFAQKIFKQIIDGLSYIHSKNIAHRDIKLDNILLDGKGNVKIADFGVSRQIQQDQIMREQCGTPAYIAPEILRNRGYSLNVDLWSAGVVLFAMLYGTVPFKAQTMEELHQLILKGKYTLKEDISEDARDLLRGLLEINPKKRLSVKRIYRHPWLKNMDHSVQLFNDEERKMIKKEYTYNDGSRYNRNENEEPVDCFTQHNLESQYSTLKNQDSKSIILAPFNSTMSEQSVKDVSQTRNIVMELMEVKQQVLRFSKKCREIDRQYEFNNNGQLDNGVYHKVVANNSFEQQDKMDETQGIEIEQTLRDDAIKHVSRKGKSAGNGRNDNQLSATEQSSFLSMADQYNIQNNKPKPLDNLKVEKLVSFGYPQNYILEQMRDMLPNYCTAGYYLLEMDQNYC